MVASRSSRIVEQGRTCAGLARVGAAAIATRMSGSRSLDDRRPRVDYPKVFVVGAARSGTSWVQSLLVASGEVVSGPESAAYPTVYRPLVTYGHRDPRAWLYALHRFRYQKRWFHHGLNNWIAEDAYRQLLARGLASPEQTPADTAETIIEGVFDRYYAAQGGTGSQVLVEKSPVHVHYGLPILRRFPRARIVEVVRDGRDAVVSALKLRETYAQKGSRTVAEVATTWRDAVEAGAALRASTEADGRVLCLRYEDLRADPLANVRRLHEFAGLTAEPETVEAVVEKLTFERLPHGPGQQRRRGEVGGWRDDLGDDDLAALYEVAGETLAGMGYV